MPNIKSAIKRVKIAEKKTLNNNIIRTKYKTAIKKYERANSEGKEEASELLSQAKKAIDHASSKGVISKNAASRKVSKLEKKLSVEKKKSAKKTTKSAVSKATSSKKEDVEGTEKKQAKKTTTNKADTATKTKKEEK